jgi:deazaflavin-dependent oxidoreductase (nitroreductase family)
MTVTLTPDGTRGRSFPRHPLAGAFVALNTGIYRLGRGRGLSARMLLLTTGGTRSGRERVVPLAYLKDWDHGWLVVASAGGDLRHPAWYRNLARHPDMAWVEFGGKKIRVRAESLHGAQREERWREITSQAPNFAAFQRQTDREIPVVRLRSIK